MLCLARMCSHSMTLRHNTKAACNAKALSPFDVLPQEHKVAWIRLQADDCCARPQHFEKHSRETDIGA